MADADNTASPDATATTEPRSLLSEETEDFVNEPISASDPHAFFKIQRDFLKVLEGKFDQNFQTLHGDISRLSAQVQEHHTILSNINTNNTSSPTSSGLNPRKRKATSDESEFIFNENDTYGSEFEDTDSPLDGIESAQSEFDTDLLSDFIRGTQKVATASQVLNAPEASGCSSGSLFLDSAEDMTKDTSIGKPLVSDKLCKVSKGLWIKKLPSEHKKLLRERTSLPENCDFLKVQWNNPDMFFLLSKPNQYVDKFAQRRQRLLSKSCAPLLRVLDSLDTLEAGDTITSDCLQSMRQNSLDAFCLLSSINTFLIEERRRHTLSSLGPRFKPFLDSLPGAKKGGQEGQSTQGSETLCGREGEFLFDDKAEKLMHKVIKSCKETQIKVSDNRSKGNFAKNSKPSQSSNQPQHNQGGRQNQTGGRQFRNPPQGGKSFQSMALTNKKPHNKWQN